MANSTVEGWSEEFRERFRVLAHRVGGMSRAADLLGYSANQMANWRDGTSSPSLFKVSRLCASGGVTVDWLLYGTVGPLAGVDPGELRSAIATLAALQPTGATAEASRSVAIDHLRADPVMARAVDWFEKTGGRIAARSGLSRELETFAIIHAVPEAGPAEYLHCGAGSMAAVYYGRDFAEDPRGHASDLDIDFESRAAEEYRLSMAIGRPRAMWVSTVAVIDGLTRCFRYNRVVLPVEIEGAAAVMVLARETHQPVLLA